MTWEFRRLHWQVLCPAWRFPMQSALVPPLRLAIFNPASRSNCCSLASFGVAVASTVKSGDSTFRKKSAVAAAPEPKFRCASSITTPIRNPPLAQLGNHAVHRQRHVLVAADLAAFLPDHGDRGPCLNEHITIPCGAGLAVGIDIALAQRAALGGQGAAGLRHQPGIGGEPKPNRLDGKLPAHRFQRTARHQGRARSGRGLQQDYPQLTRNPRPVFRFAVTLRVHLQDMDIQARQIHPKSNPPDTGTEHLRHHQRACGQRSRLQHP